MIATVIENTGHGSFILRYRTMPKWQPVITDAQTSEAAMMVELRQDFIEKRCQEWNL